MDVMNGVTSLVELVSNRFISSGWLKLLVIAIKMLGNIHGAVRPLDGHRGTDEGARFTIILVAWVVVFVKHFFIVKDAKIIENKKSKEKHFIANFSTFS